MRLSEIFRYTRMVTLHDIFAALASAIAAGGAISAMFVFIIKKYLDKRLDVLFASQEEKLKREHQLIAKYVNFVQDKELSIYPEMIETVYRLERTVRDQEGVPLGKWPLEFVVLYDHLAENLFK